MDIVEYMRLPYTITIRHIEDESGGYFYATVLELDGCQSSGDTYQEAYERIQEAMEGFIETKLEGGFEVPLPTAPQQDYSGKMLLRMPKTLHQRLALEAKLEGISLNQYALYKLAR